MPKLMGPVSGSINASTLEPMVNDRSNATGPSKTADGGFDAQKYTPTGALWPSTPQIRGDRFANFRRQRQLATLAALAADTQLSRVPVYVIELERCHFTGTQAKACEQEQDGVIATPRRGAPVDAGQQLADLVRRNRPGYR